MKTNLENLLEFPCDFPFKVVGVTDATFVDQVMVIIQKYVPGEYAPSVKPSAKGNYQSVSVTIRAENIQQIEGLYEELGAIEGVKLVL